VGEDRLVKVSLDDRERRFLRAALLDWGGPAQPTQELALAMGFRDAEHLAEDTWRLWDCIDADSALSVEDWRRVLLTAEVVFVSDVVGSGLDWAITSGISDEESIAILRDLQRKLPRWRNSFQFTVDQRDHVIISDPDRPSS
jgi:hypothetical protein